MTANRIAPKILMTLEECMEYIQHDECIEVTPNFIRMRKVIISTKTKREIVHRTNDAMAQ
jgi:GTP-binding protein